MDLAETLQRLLQAAGSAGEISVGLFTEMLPPGLSAEDVEQLINDLNAQGVWIVDD